MVRRRVDGVMRKGTEQGGKGAGGSGPVRGGGMCKGGSG